MSCRNRREISPFFSDGLAESVLPFLSFHAVSISQRCRANLEIWESFQSLNKNCALSSEITGPESRVPERVTSRFTARQTIAGIKASRQQTRPIYYLEEKRLAHPDERRKKNTTRTRSAGRDVSRGGGARSWREYRKEETNGDARSVGRIVRG